MRIIFFACALAAALQGSALRATPAPEAGDASAPLAKALLRDLQRMLREELLLEPQARLFLDIPFREFSVRAESLRAYRSGADPGSLLTDVRRRLYPAVDADGDLALAFLLSRDGGRWEEAGYAPNDLVKELRYWRWERSGGGKRDMNGFFWVSIPEKGLDFLGEAGAEGLLLIPLADHRLKAWKRGKAVPASEVFRALAAGG